MLLPTAAPPTRPMIVAAARPEPPPMALPIAPPAIAPNTAPAPELGCCTAMGCTLQTSRGTATCWITGVLEITRPISSAATLVPAAANAPIAENRTAFFIEGPLEFPNAQILGKTVVQARLFG